MDNDVFGAQDQGYSNGILMMLTSSDLSDGSRRSGLRDGRGCHWPITRWLARHLGVLRPAGSGQQNLTASFAQATFTPDDREQEELIPHDRPYAAALLLGLGYNARSGNRLQTTLLQVGIVGPSARGRQAQNEIHKLVGDRPFRGWDNQLGDEGVFRLLHERLQRHAPKGRWQPGGDWRWDGVTHWGASLGNLLTHLGAGGELRFGQRLPDDFGTAPVRPAGEYTSRPPPADAGFRAHAFASVDARWVLRDISLDGNAFRASHHVDKQPFVADLGYGLALTHGPWKVMFARFHRTREFKGQRNRPVFGSVSVSRAF